MKRTIQAIKKSLQTSLKIPGSKNITYRALLLASLSEGISHISYPIMNNAATLCIENLTKLGIDIHYDASQELCVIEGSGGNLPNLEASLWCGDANTIARFLLAITARAPGNYFFDGSPQLRERSFAPLLSILQRQGAQINPPKSARMPFSIFGQESLMGGEIEVDGFQTGQLISALLLIAPFAKTSFVLKAPNLINGAYVELTSAMMGEFGVMVRRFHHESFSVPVPQRYTSCDYIVEPDLSLACYFFAAAAILGGRITIQPIYSEVTKQHEVFFLQILEKMGCKITENENGLSIERIHELKGVNIDMRYHADIFSQLVSIAPFAKTPTAITNIHPNRLQESNRIHLMIHELEKINVKIEKGVDWIKIYPSKPDFGVINPHHDYRIAMACSILGLASGIEIEETECVTRVYPNFYELLEMLY